MKAKTYRLQYSQFGNKWELDTYSKSLDKLRAEYERRIQNPYPGRRYRVVAPNDTIICEG